jgi:hypothetical protein
MTLKEENRTELNSARRFAAMSSGFQNTAAVIGIMLFVATCLTGVIPFVFLSIDGAYNNQIVAALFSALAGVSVAFVLAVLVFFRVHLTVAEITQDAKTIVEAKRIIRREADVISDIEGLLHETRLDIRRVSVRVRALKREGFDRSEVESQIYGNWRKYTTNYLNVVRGIFESLTGESCSCCIKLLGWKGDSAAGVPIFDTMMRDSRSYRRRKYIDRNRGSYPVRSSVAFNQIINDPEFDHCFHSDNLSGVMNYSRSNPDRDKHYNATIVSRIGSRIYGIDKNGVDRLIGYDLVGFLCIDNMSGGLSTPHAVNIMRLAAEIYDEYLNCISRLHFHSDEYESAEREPREGQLENRWIGLKTFRVDNGVAYQKSHMVIWRLWQRQQIALKAQSLEDQEAESMNGAQ